MTFVAQPYEQFVDDLLTALTGGMVREEHHFTGTEGAYSLASPNSVPASIKVFGQRNNTFILFERGIDYIYDQKKEAIVWKEDGKLPDDRSFFYVNYYSQEGKRRLTDRNPGSVTTTLAEVFGRELAVLHKQMEMIYNSAFVDLATGSSLDHVAALFDITRKDARFASGEVLFKRSTPAPADITIPTGALISTDQGQNFETTDKRTLRKGQLSVAVPIRAQVEGSAGRVETNAIKNINRPIFGIESVLNEKATFFATAKETDEELRRRIKGTLERAGKSTINAIKYGLIEEIPEITEGNIQVTENNKVPGFVEVKLGLESTGDSDLVRRIEESIFNSRAAGIRVIHNLPTRTQSVSVQRAGVRQPDIAREETLPQIIEQGTRQEAVPLPKEVLQRMPGGILPLRARVLLRLTERNLSVSQKEDIEDDIRNRVMNYIEALPMGSDLIYNKLLGNIVQPENISDVCLLIGANAEYDNKFYQSNLATDGRKTQIDPNSISVGLMEESVFVDILVKLEPRNKTVGAKVTEELRATVVDAINRLLKVTKGKLSKTDIRSKIGDAIQAAQTDPDLQLIAGNSAVILNAEYEETGRLLNNTGEIILEENHLLELRKLNIEIRGVLDGQI